MTQQALPATFANFQPPEKTAIQKVRYTHDAMIDLIVGNPWISQGELARHFGYTEGWVSQVIASDVFQARLAERRNEIVDPTLRATIEDKFKGLIERSYRVLMRKLEDGKVSDETVLKTLEVAARAAGYGSKSAQVNVQANFVAVVPAKAASSAEWANQVHGAGGQPVTIPPASKTAQTVEDAVLVDSRPAAPNAAALLDELKNG